MAEAHKTLNTDQYIRHLKEEQKKLQSHKWELEKYTGKAEK